MGLEQPNCLMYILRCRVDDMTPVPSLLAAKAESRADLNISNGVGVLLKDFICDFKSIYQLYGDIFQEFRFRSDAQDAANVFLETVRSTHKARVQISSDSEDEIVFVAVHNRRTDFVKVLNRYQGTLISTKYFEVTPTIFGRDNIVCLLHYIIWR